MKRHSFIFIFLFTSCPNILTISNLEVIQQSAEYRNSISYISSMIPKSELKIDDITFGTSSDKRYSFFVFKNNIDKYVSARMLDSAGRWEPDLLNLYQYLWETDIDMRNYAVIDVGANLGSFTLFAASLGSKVWAFEMQPFIATLLNASITISKYNHLINLYNVPLWNSNITVSFSPVYSNPGNTTAAPGTQGTYALEAHTLSEYFTSSDYIFFLKLDVEGAEKQVLDGFRIQLRSRKVCNLVMEVRPGQQKIVRWLYQLGYRCRLYARHSSARCKGAVAQPSCFWKSYRNFMDSLRKLIPRNVVGREDYIDIYCRQNCSLHLSTEVHRAKLQFKESAPMREQLSVAVNSIEYNYTMTLRSCLGPECTDSRTVRSNIDRVGVLALPHSGELAMLAVVRKATRKTVKKFELELDTHVPAYGNWKNHGWNRIVRISRRLIPHAYALLKWQYQITGNDSTIPIDAYVTQIRQLIRWHCRLSHVAAHTKLLTVFLEDVFEKPVVEMERMITFIGLPMLRPELFAAVSELRSELRSLRREDEDEAVPVRLRTVGLQVLEEEMRSSHGLTDWPCKPFRLLDVSGDVGKTASGRGGGSGDRPGPGPGLPLHTRDLAANCSSPFVKCTVRFDLRELVGL